MTQIIVPQRRVWTRQPQRPAGIDWKNPLTKGLAHAIIPVGRKLYDLVTKKFATDVNAPTIDVASVGRVHKTVAGSSQYSYFDTPLTSASVTIFSRHIQDTSATSCVFSLGTASSTERLAVFYGSTAGKYTSSTVPNPGGTTDSQITGSTGVVNDVAIISDVSTPAKLYVNGAVDQGDYAWAPTGVVTRLYISARMNSTAGVFNSQRSAVILAFSRPLTVDELNQIRENPWQIFARRDRRTIIDLGGSGLSAVYADSALSYYIRSLLSSDSGIQYAIRNAIYKDDAVGYYLRSAIAQNSEVGYVLRSAIAKDDAEAYKIRGLVQSSDAEAYSIRGLVQTSDSEAYKIRSQIQADASASYDIQSSTSVASSNAVNYSVRGSVAASASLSYSVRGSVQKDTASAYSVRSAVSRDAAASYSVSASASSVYADSTASYSVDGVVPSGPSAESIAAAVLAALQSASPMIPVNAVQGAWPTAAENADAVWSKELP